MTDNTINRASTVPPEVRAQVERAMGDPMRMMPSERLALERQGFVANPDIWGALWPAWLRDMAVERPMENEP